ncbi:MAG: GIY-YIG nuclease family protein [Acidobacteriota bacterium]
MPGPFYVYILSSKGKRLYIGFTHELENRVWEHKNKIHPESFTAKYNIDQLVYRESFGLAIAAITREKELKSWNRIKKVALIVSTNPTWRDLSLDWGKPTKPFSEAELKPPKTFGDL